MYLTFFRNVAKLLEICKWTISIHAKFLKFPEVPFAFFCQFCTNKLPLYSSIRILKLNSYRVPVLPRIGSSTPFIFTRAFELQQSFSAELYKSENFRYIRPMALCKISNPTQTPQIGTFCNDFSRPTA